jgi:acetyl-CoA synthetase
MEMVKEINKVIMKEIGNIAICDDIVFVPGLPKTRSGKIMRSIAKGEAITQDISTLEAPSIVATIEAKVKG